MTQETIEPSQRAREAASDIARYGSPGLGNGNTIVAAEIKGGLHDDYALAQAFARFEREVSTNKDETIAKLREALENARPYVADAVRDDGGVHSCDIALRMDLESIDAALTSTKKEG